jgi:hypothetical protein
MTSQVVRMPRTGDSLQVGAQTEAPQSEGIRVLSDDETIRSQKAMLLLEYQEAEDRLARLKQRAAVIGNDNPAIWAVVGGGSDNEDLRDWPGPIRPACRLFDTPAV